MNVFLRKRWKVGENLRRRRAFGEAREYGLQRHARTLEDWLATHNLRVTDDAVLIVHVRYYCSAIVSAPMVYTAGDGANAMTKTTKLSRNGRSQAVRLPREFRFEGDRVRVRRAGRGVLVEPMFANVADWFAELDRYGAEPFMAEGRQQPGTPERKIFRS